MRRRLTAALLALALLLTDAALAEGFNYITLDVQAGMPSNYVYQEKGNRWSASALTLDNPYVMLLAYGDLDGKDIVISLDAYFDENDDSPNRLDFIIDDKVHTLRLSQEAQEQGLSGFWLYGGNFKLARALAEAKQLRVIAYFGDAQYPIEVDEDGLRAFTFLAKKLVEGEVIENLNEELFSGDSVRQMDKYIEYYELPYAGDAYELDEPTAATDEDVDGLKSVPPTLGELNAKKMAKEYLEVMAFSYSGLIEQLEYEGFSHSEAEFGANGCGADWYEQADRMAAQYLDVMSFSRSGLIEQLEYEGFTHDQAVYGVEKNGY